MQPKILAFAGSARTASLNRRLLDLAARHAREAGAEVTVVDLRDHPMPVYDGDAEAAHGLPEAALRLRTLLGAHQGLLVASPEHNGSVTALLKNTLDWCSRPAGSVDGLGLVRGKTVALLSASPSPYGGVRSVAHLRGIFSKMGATVLADEVLLAHAPAAFDAEGRLVDALADRLTRQLAVHLVQHVRRVQAP